MILLYESEPITMLLNIIVMIIVISILVKNGNDRTK